MPSIFQKYRIYTLLPKNCALLNLPISSILTFRLSKRNLCKYTQHDPSIYPSHRLPIIQTEKYLRKRIRRSVRESVPAVPRQTDQKEEDLCEEEHFIPGVQRDPGVRRARGKYRGRQPHSESDRLRQVSERQDRRIIQICDSVRSSISTI